MGTIPYDPQADAGLISSSGAIESRAFVAHYKETAVALGVITDVHAAVTDTGVLQTITTGITDPSPCRNLTATSGGTAGDIKAIQITVTGTNLADDVITETLPVFTVNSATTVVGSKAFKTVTSISIPAHDGTGATTSIGSGAKLGIAHKLGVNSLLDGQVYFNGSVEGTEPTVAGSATLTESNTVTLNTALDGSDVEFFYIVPADA